MPKRFTHAEAQSLIPQVGHLLTGAVAAKTEYQEAESAIQQFTERVMMMGGVTVDRDGSARSHRTGAGDRLRAEGSRHRPGGFSDAPARSGSLPVLETGRAGN